MDYNKETIIELLDKMIEEPSTAFKSWTEMFGILCMLGSLAEKNFIIAYDNGWRIKPDSKGAQYHDPTRTGYTVEVGGYYTARSDGAQERYDEPVNVLYAGLQLLKASLTGEDSDG